MRSAMTRNDLRRKNARLRDQIAQVVEKDPELRDVTEGIALRQDLHVEVGTPFLRKDKWQAARAGASHNRG